MAHSDFLSITSKAANRDVGLLVVSGLMAALSGATAFLLGAWSIGVFLIAMLYPTPIVPIGHSELAGIDIVKNVGDTQICDIVRGVRYCRLVKPGAGQLLDSPESLIWYIVNISIHIIPLIIITVGLWEVCKSFQSMKKGLFFDLKTIGHLRNFAISGFLFTICAPNTQWLCEQLSRGFGPLVSAIRGWQFHAEGRIFETFTAMNFQSSPIFGVVLTSTILVVFALTLAVITAVMAKAAAIVQDHAQIV